MTTVAAEQYRTAAQRTSAHPNASTGCARQPSPTKPARTSRPVLLTTAIWGYLEPRSADE